MVKPAPPSCFPDWHIQVTVVVTLAILAVLVGAVFAIRRKRGRPAPGTVAVVAVSGLAAVVIVGAPNRFLPIW